jgi:ribosomal protein L32
MSCPRSRGQFKPRQALGQATAVTDGALCPRRTRVPPTNKLQNIVLPAPPCRTSYTRDNRGRCVTRKSVMNCSGCPNCGKAKITAIYTFLGLTHQMKTHALYRATPTHPPHLHRPIWIEFPLPKHPCYRPANRPQSRAGISPTS